MGPATKLSSRNGTAHKSDCEPVMSTWPRSIVQPANQRACPFPFDGPVHRLHERSKLHAFLYVRISTVASFVGGVMCTSVKSHTFRRALHGPRFLCRKTYIPATEDDATGLGNLTGSRAVAGEKPN